VPDVHIVVQDLDGTELSGRFYQSMQQVASEQVGIYEIYPTEPDYAMSQDIITEYELTAAVVIPAGFEANVLSGEAVDLEVFVDESTNRATYVLDGVEAAIAALDVPGQVVGIETVDIEVGEGFVFVDFLLPGVVAAAVMINCLMILSSLMADYWAHGYFKMLMTTPLRKWEWILSKLIWYVVVMAISIALMIALGIFVFDSTAKVTLVAVALVLAGIVMFSAIGIFLGAWAKNSDTAAGLAQLVGQPMLWLSGIFWQLEELPKFIQTIAKFLPLTYLGRGLRETMINGNDAAALKDLAIVAGLAVVLFVAASNLISWKEK
jgi:ABC-2 type transport system permease protein